jgi:hypothetical protein
MLLLGIWVIATGAVQVGVVRTEMVWLLGIIGIASGIVLLRENYVRW